MATPRTGHTGTVHEGHGSQNRETVMYIGIGTLLLILVLVLLLT
jgi:hypothetical protein